jgi:arylamine N-acetyltransferase
MDIASYYARIGYTGSPSPTLATLNAIVARRVQSVPFENLDILLHRPIAIDLSTVAGTPLFEFILEHVPAVDRELGNWYTSAHPKSHFREHLMVARATTSARQERRDDRERREPRSGATGRARRRSLEPQAVAKRVHRADGHVRIRPRCAPQIDAAHRQQASDAFEE